MGHMERHETTSVHVAIQVIPVRDLMPQRQEIGEYTMIFLRRARALIMPHTQDSYAARLVTHPELLQYHLAVTAHNKSIQCPIAHQCIYVHQESRKWLAYLETCPAPERIAHICVFIWTSLKAACGYLPV